MTNNTDKPMELREKVKKTLVRMHSPEVGHYGCSITDKEIDETVALIKEAIQATREETVEEIQKWNFNNGITHKKSFAALKNYLDSLTNKSENK